MDEQRSGAGVCEPCETAAVYGRVEKPAEREFRPYTFFKNG